MVDRLKRNTAAKTKNIKTKNLDFLDAPLRGVKNVTGRNPLRPKEIKLISKLMRLIVDLKPGIIMAPLGVRLGAADLRSRAALAAALLGATCAASSSAGGGAPDTCHQGCAAPAPKNKTRDGVE